MARFVKVQGFARGLSNPPVEEWVNVENVLSIWQSKINEPVNGCSDVLYVETVRSNGHTILGTAAEFFAAYEKPNAYPSVLDALRQIVAWHNMDHEATTGYKIQKAYDQAINAAKKALAEAAIVAATSSDTTKEQP
jgi:hypothetical protein